eukprot:TRINITY_DN4699_c0_g1_i1.p1 TRINITY_DN4699_c0_g1~~TRINITY_DN4699_c0_g1_i1.p1  ORF type:complete len:254 (+),score=50.55 TRINITY_DN4699_c0_g1_i1:212-973(+)
MGGLCSVAEEEEEELGSKRRGARARDRKRRAVGGLCSVAGEEEEELATERSARRSSADKTKPRGRAATAPARHRHPAVLYSYEPLVVPPAAASAPSSAAPAATTSVTLNAGAVAAAAASMHAGALRRRYFDVLRRHSDWKSRAAVEEGCADLLQLATRRLRQVTSSPHGLEPASQTQLLAAAALERVSQKHVLSSAWIRWMEVVCVSAMKSRLAMRTPPVAVLKGEVRRLQTSFGPYSTADSESAGISTVITL